MIEPESGLTARNRTLLRVVLPQPLSPTSPRHSPRSILRLMASTATTRGPDLALPNKPLLRIVQVFLTSIHSSRGAAASAGHFLFSAITCGASPAPIPRVGINR